MLRRLFANWKLKLWALMIALGIWFYADSQMTEDMPVHAELEIHPPAKHRLLYPVTAELSFSLSGPSALLRAWNRSHRGPPKLNYKLAQDELRMGWAELEIDADWLRASLFGDRFVRLRPRDIRPAKVKAFCSPITRRKLPVRAAKFSLPSGLRYVEEPSFSPPIVTVEGPAVAVDAMEAVEVQGLPQPQPGKRLLSVALQDEVPVDLGDDLSVPVKLKIEPPNVMASISVTGEAEREQVFQDVQVLLQMLPTFPYLAEMAEGEGVVSVTVRAAPAALRRTSTITKAPAMAISPTPAERIKAYSHHKAEESFATRSPSTA